jgi:methylenetetrahydrofolate reductase (NADPH)
VSRKDAGGAPVCVRARSPYNAGMDTSPRPASLLAERLRSGTFAITAEITPPLSCVPDDVTGKAVPLRGLVDAVNVTDGAGARAHMSATAAAFFLVQAGIEPVLQFTCRDRNRLALQSSLLGAAAVGIRNVLLLGGDDPSAGDQPDTKAVFDLDSRRLIETARIMRDRRELPNGKPIAGAPQFFIGAADMPIDPPPEWRPDALRGKIAAGAQFVQTQFCMDAGIVRRYVGRLRDDGVTDQLAVLIGIAPLRSARSARWMRRHLFGTVIPDATVARMEGAADPAQEGRRIAVELMQEFAQIPGVAGVHLMAPGNDAAVPDVIAAFRKSRGQS